MDKTQIINNVLLKMAVHISSNAVTILRSVLVEEFHGVEIKETETLPASVDKTNEYIMRLFEMKKQGKLSSKTSKYYLDSVRTLIDVIQKPLTHVTEEDIEYMQLYFKKRENCNTSINNQIRNMSAFFTFMRKNKLITFNPCESVEKLPEEEKVIEHLEAQEWEQLKTGCRTIRDRAMIEYLRCTACRRGEIPRVRVKDINFNKGNIIIYGEKSRRHRPVGLDDVALHYINQYIEKRGISRNSDEPLFVINRKKEVKALDDSGIYGSIKRIAKRSGIEKNVYPHLLRKTTATNIVKRGGSVADAGEYLGHADQSTAGKHYAFRSEDHVLRIFHDLVAAV